MAYCYYGNPFLFQYPGQQLVHYPGQFSRPRQHHAASRDRSRSHYAATSSDESDSSGSDSGSSSDDGSPSDNGSICGRVQHRDVLLSRGRTGLQLLRDTRGRFEVANVNNTTIHRGPRAWKQTWLREFGRRRWPDRCQIHGCGRTAAVGGHMYIRHLMDYGDYNYILPICSVHNGSPDLNHTGSSRTTDWLMVKMNAGFVRVRAHPESF